VNILALNTTKMKAQIITSIENKNVFFNTKETDKHSESLLPNIEKILINENANFENIDVFSVVIGPGSFTGIRIGVSLVKAFLFMKNKKCVAVNSFELLAYNIKENSDYFIALNADNRGAYVAKLENEKIAWMRLFTLKDLELECESSNLPLYIKSEEDSYFSNLNCNKKFIVENENALLEVTKEKTKLNDFTSINTLEPLYIKLSQAEDQFREKLIKNIVIENAGERELNELTKLENNIFKTEAYSKESLLQILKDEYSSIFLAKLNDEIMGYAIIQKTPDELLEILKIAVKEQYQKLGVATKIFEQIELLKKVERLYNIMLEVNEHNEKALAFYKKMGFKELNKREKYYKNGDTAIVMIK